MAHPALVESLFSRRRSRNLSIYSTARSSDDLTYLEDQKIRVRFSVEAKTVFGWEVKVIGNVKALGNWNPKDAPLLTTSEGKYPIWTSGVIPLQLTAFPFNFEYKYIIVNKRQEIKWESFTQNRTATCTEKSSKKYIYEISDTFNVLGSAELKVVTKDNFTQALSKIPYMNTLEEQLAELSDLLLKEVISFNTLALSFIVVKNMKNPVGSNYSSYNSFIDWCSRNITVQQTKILLGATMPASLWLAEPTAELIEKIEDYYSASQTAGDDISHMLALSELRMALLNEYKTSEDISGLLITDTYLEKNELIILDRVIENIEEQEVWKISMTGMWVSQMLFLQCFKPKQTSSMIKQFEKLTKQESIEILRDLLNELLLLLLELYDDVYIKVNHQECEALAALLKSEYKILYHGIFMVCSHYLLRTLPMLNKLLIQIPFMCYNSGSCKGFLWVMTRESPMIDREVILVAEELPDEFQLSDNVKAVVILGVDSLFNTCLLAARRQGLPVAIGYFPPIIEGEYIVSINEDSYTIQRA